jgi:hypothetical protein
VEASFPFVDDGIECTYYWQHIKQNVTGHVDVERTGTYLLTYESEDHVLPVDEEHEKHGGTDCAKLSRVVKTVVVVDTMKPVLAVNYRGQTLKEHHDGLLETHLMADGGSINNAWVVGAVASAVAGIALLGFAAAANGRHSPAVPV